MLPAAHRLTDPADFRRATKRGRRSGAGTLVAHLLVQKDYEATPVRAGLAVSKAVGNAVTRNRVKRRLRHALRDQLDRLPAGALLVLRAKPAAGQASYAVLARDLDRCLTACTRPVEAA